MEPSSSSSSQVKLIAPIEAEKAKYLPPHIVISSALIHSDMEEKRVYELCESLVDCLFFCIVKKVQPGVYLPADIARKQEENKTLFNPTSSDEDSNNDQLTQQQQQQQEIDGNYDKDRNKLLLSQCGGKAAIIKSIMDSLDESFFPFYMQAVDSEEDRARFEEKMRQKEKQSSSAPDDQNDNNDIQDGEGKTNSTTTTKRIVIKDPEVGCAFSKRGEMMTMGSLAGCGLGIAGVFANGQ